MLSASQLYPNRCYFEKHSNGQYQYFYLYRFYQNKNGRSVKLLLLGWDSDLSKSSEFTPIFSLTELYPKKVYAELSPHDSIKAIFGEYWGLKKPS